MIIRINYETVEEIKNLPNGTILESGLVYPDGYVDWDSDYEKTTDGLVSPFDDCMIWEEVAASLAVKSNDEDNMPRIYASVEKKQTEKKQFTCFSNIDMI